MIHINRLKAVPFLLAIVGLETVAQGLLKKAHETNDMKNILYATCLYGVICVLLYHVYNYMKISLVNSVWSVLSIISIIVIGQIYFNETLEFHDKIAIILMLIGIFIIYFVNGKE